ncbi:DUF4905 domain-containing protein [Flammeovirga sp. EKP202]|uniref:DUF4905 domain-containing protein n=1 Tax=Flammeovirga sp. EKP202 TaxID=2770592 RepID=UPI00165EBF01|nr:DUF4905 domain-containing protein [Flammeovirga sp. EKP202]MBD0403312.1 DUF4905 domain-containing protein [Flammeovirga sp. EKP202]
MENKYTFEAHGIIWRVMYDHTIGVILLEMRDGDQKEVSFAALEVKTGIVLWEGLQLEENWWISMAGVKDGFLYFSEFDQNDAIPKVKKLQKLNIKEATLVEDNQEDPSQLSSAEEFELPIVYPVESEYYATLSTFLKQLEYDVAESDIHYYETSHQIIFVFIERKNSVLQRKLLICSRKGEVLFQEVIDTDIRDQIMDSFFMVDNMLLYIKEKEIWCGLSLTALNN